MAGANRKLPLCRWPRMTQTSLQQPCPLAGRSAATNDGSRFRGSWPAGEAVSRSTLMGSNVQVQAVQRISVKSNTTAPRPRLIETHVRI